MIFLVIGIVGYLSVPTVANFVVHAHGGNSMLYKVTSIVTGGSSTAMQYGGQAGMAAGERMGRGAINIVNAPFDVMDGYNGAGKEKQNSHQHDKLSGK